VLLKSKETGSSSFSQLLVDDPLQVIAKRPAAHHDFNPASSFHVPNIGIDIWRSQFL
jgi:hypothetical protein